MGDDSDYIQGYAVVRVDQNCPPELPSHTLTGSGTQLLAPGPSNVTVKEIVLSADEARREVERLNKLNSGKDCSYYWQSTHIFLQGGSYGSKGDAAK